MKIGSRFLSNVGVAMVIAIAISCSGGSGGGGTATPPPPSPTSATLSVTPNTIMENWTTDQTTVGLQVSMSVDKWPSGTTLYFQVVSSSKGIGNIHYLSTSSGTTGATVILSLTFRNPWAIGEGIYSDTLTVNVSTDAAGLNQILNSPQVIPVTYSVTGPSILGMSPNAVIASGSDFALTVTGMNFTPTTSILWNMVSLPTTYVSPTMLTAQVSAAQIANAGSANVSVVRTIVGSGGFISNIFVLPIQTVASTPGGLSPGSATAGGPAFTLNVSGTNFQPTTYLQWNTDFLTTTYVSPTMITAQVPASEITGVGSASLYVVNGWGTTNWFQFPVVAPGSAQSGTVQDAASIRKSEVPDSVNAQSGQMTIAFPVINQ